MNMSCLPSETLPLASLSDDVLAEQITTLAAHINAARAYLLDLIREFDERAPFGALGLKSTAHWLNWRCGIALGAAREKVRTARALGALPKVREAFHSGRLSYSKVRAITRVCTAEIQVEFLNIAVEGTAAQVETIVRNYRQVQRLQNPNLARAQHLDRSLSWYWDDAGALVFNGRLPPEQGALLEKALERMVDLSSQGEHPDVSAETLFVPAEEPFDSDPMQSGPTQLSQTQSGQLQPARIDKGPPITTHTLRRLLCDCALISVLESADGEPLNVGRKTRSIPPAIPRALKKRDGGCRFPGCTSHRYVDAHHIQHWAESGKTKMANLVLICRHHHRLLHEGAIASPGSPGSLRPLRPLRPPGDLRPLRLPRPPRPQPVSSDSIPRMARPSPGFKIGSMQGPHNSSSNSPGIQAHAPAFRGRARLSQDLPPATGVHPITITSCGS